jgi:hypothetical protein
VRENADTHTHIYIYINTHRCHIMYGLCVRQSNKIFQNAMVCVCVCECVCVYVYVYVCVCFNRRDSYLYTQRHTNAYTHTHTNSIQPHTHINNKHVHTLTKSNKTKNSSISKRFAKRLEATDAHFRNIYSVQMRYTDLNPHFLTAWQNVFESASDLVCVLTPLGERMLIVSKKERK